MEENINEHDMTKKMLDSIRTNTNVVPNEPEGEKMDGYDYDKKMIEAIQEGALYGEEDDNDTIELEGEELKEEQDKFRQTVGSRVEFTVFNLYPEANNVIFGGKFQNLSGMEFQLSLEGDDGIYITTNNMQLTDEAVKTLNRLRGYYVDWADEWATKLATEYKNR